MRPRQKIAAVAKRAVARARIVGKVAAKQLVEATDAALVAQGKAARARQRKRAVKTALKRVVKTAAIAGAAAATIVAVRAAGRRRNAVNA